MPESARPGAFRVLTSRSSRRTVFRRAVSAGAMTALSTVGLHRDGVAAGSNARSLVSAPQGVPMTQATPGTGGAPTVVLVHGAFADASGWAGVITALSAEGITVVAPANPLRGVSHDAAYIASVVNQIPGPVLL